MKKAIKHFSLGLLTGAILLGGFSFAGATTKMPFTTTTFKLVVAGIQKNLKNDVGLVYNGMLYVPTSAITDGFGEVASWDGKAKKLNVGRNPNGNEYLTSMNYARADGIGRESLFFTKWKSPEGLKFNIADNTFLNGMGIIMDTYDFYNDEKDDKGSIEYNLNGKYTILSGLIGIDDFTKNSKNSATVIIFGDDKELLRLDTIKGGDLAKEFKCDLTGVLKLKISFETEKSIGDQINLVLTELKLK